MGERESGGYGGDGTSERGEGEKEEGGGENTEREKGSRVSGSGDMAGAGRKPAVSSASSRLRRVSLRLGIAACHPVQATHHRRKTLRLGIAIATCAPAATTEGLSLLGDKAATASRRKQRE